MAVASSPPDAVGQNPIPTRPPLAAIPSRCASDRLRALSRTPRTPVCEATTGRVETASASSMVRAELWATSSRTPRASIRRIISRPFGGEPVLLDAVRRATEHGVEEVGRRDHPDAGIGHDLHVGRVAVERVCPSIESRPAVIRGLAAWSAR